jgi:hypothetical protein
MTPWSLSLFDSALISAYLYLEKLIIRICLWPIERRLGHQLNCFLHPSNYTHYQCVKYQGTLLNCDESQFANGVITYLWYEVLKLIYLSLGQLLSKNTTVPSSFSSQPSALYNNYLSTDNGGCSMYSLPIAALPIF